MTQTPTHKGQCASPQRIPRTMGEAFGHDIDHTIQEAPPPTSTAMTVVFVVVFFASLAVLIFYGNDLQGIVWELFK